ncbi:MAG TPA: nicotinamide riboside transporter PnuC [Steroidobacteraceae bacterium]
MSEFVHAWHGIVVGLEGTSVVEVIAVVLALASSVQEVARSRWCWLTGGLSSAILIYLALRNQLPMQGALQACYVVMSIYGWRHWSREASRQGTLIVTTGSWRSNLLACLVVVGITAVTARWLATDAREAWPFLDSLTTWGSLLATWLMARVKLENWLYWIAADSLQVFLFGAQGLYFVALLSVVYLGVSAVGFLRWQKVYRNPIPVS